VERRIPVAPATKGRKIHVAWLRVMTHADPQRVIANHGRAVNGVSCAADGRILSAGFAGAPVRGALHQVKLWSRTGEALGGFGAGTQVVCHYAAMSPDGRTVAAGFGDLTVRLWDATSNEVRTLGSLGGIVASLAWSADGKTLACVLPGDVVAIIDPESGRVRSRFRGFPGPEPKELLRLRPGDSFICLSDGLLDLFGSIEEAREATRETVTACSGPDEVVQVVLDYARDHLATDDATVVVVRRDSM